MRKEPNQPNSRPEATSRQRRSTEAVTQAANADASDEFWGAEPDWTGGYRRNSRDPLNGGLRANRATSTNTGMIAALRDGVAAFKPQLRDGSGPIERTRTHGVIDPSMSRPAHTDGGTRDAQRVPVAKGRASIAELGAGDIGEDFEPHPWEHASIRRVRRADQLDEASPTPRITELDHTGPIAFFDREVDEYARETDSDLDGDFEAYAHLEFESLSGGLGYGASAMRSPRAMALAALVVATVIAVPFLLAGKSSSNTQSADPGQVMVGSSLPVLGANAPSAAAGATVPAQASPSVPADGSVAGADSATTLAPSASGAATNVDASTAGGSSSASAPRESELVAAPAVSTSTVAPSAQSQDPEQDEAPSVASTTAPPTTAPPTTAAPTTTQPTCALHYQAAPGDSWYRIADEAGISPKSLLSVNKASVDTVILPGADICLPAGATKPSPPTTTTATSTTAPATTAPPKTTTAPKPVSSTTVAPAATTVPAGSPGRNATPAQVQQIIRDVFPDEAEAKALDVARLESTYSPTAYNGWCCYGIFQIYYSVHAKWLPNFGVNKPEDLYDPLVNAKVALEIYRRAGNSFRPWTTA